MSMLRQKVENHLKNGILPFWEKLIDRENGGYYGYLDFDLQLDKKAVKGCILNSRILWFFSNVYLVTGDESALPYADHAYEFMIKHCLDRTNGGIYWSVTYDGKAEDTIKHTYNQAFAIYALASYYDASGQGEALRYAMELFDMLESRCRLGEGYGEAYTVSFQPAENDKLSENNIIAAKTMNTMLHICEAYTELYRVSKEPRVRERLKWTLKEFYERVYNPRLHRLEVFFDENMHSLIDLHSYGHDIEASWLLDRALDILQDEEMSRRLEPMITDLAEEIYKTAYRDDSVMAENENGVDLTTRVWWVQCEAIVGFWNIYQKTGREMFREAAEHVWAYVEKYLLDPREGSEWFSEVEENHKPESRKPIVEPWKCPYHNGRMCLEIIKRVQSC